MPTEHEPRGGTATREPVGAPPDPGTAEARAARRDPLRTGALGILVVVHVLGALGAPFAAGIHFGQPGATDHQNFHVLWEAFKYFTASIFALGLVLGPLRAGRRWAAWLLAAGTTTLFGGVFISHAATGGGPTIDLISYGAFLVLSFPALAVLAARGPRRR